MSHDETVGAPYRCEALTSEDSVLATLNGGKMSGNSGKGQGKTFVIAGLLCFLGNLVGPAVAGQSPSGVNYAFAALGGGLALVGLIKQ